MFKDVQGLVYLILSVGAFAVEAYAFVHALARTDGQYRAAGKRTKAFWGTLTGVAAAIGFLALPAPLGAASVAALGLLGLGAVIVAGVFLADVLPALRHTSRGGPPKRNRGTW